MAQAPAGAGGDGGARARLIARSVAVALLLVLVGLDLLIPDPFTFAWRQSFALALAACGLAACIVLLFAGYRWLAVLFAAAAGLAVWQDVEPWIARRQVLARTGADVIDVERHFVVGYTDVAVVRELIRDSHVGGIFLTRRNVAHRTSMTSQRRSRACRICGGPQACRRWSLPPIRKADRFRISRRRCRAHRLSLRLQRCRPLDNSKPRAEPVSIREGRCGCWASP